MQICLQVLYIRLEIQDKEVGAGGFSLRTEEIHTNHLKTLEENSLNNCYGVKTKCVLSEKLTTFNVTCSFPPDIVHDLFEGIVPVEISLSDCIHFQKVFHFGHFKQGNRRFSI